MKCKVCEKTVKQKDEYVIFNNYPFCLQYIQDLKDWMDAEIKQGNLVILQIPQNC